MDLSTVAAKLAQGLYKDRFEFQADLRLMTNNAKHYNMVGSVVHNAAIALETMFEKGEIRYSFESPNLLTFLLF
jgi:transcription initiation factor TFIID subunit 2